jgi:hypothetical protein
MATEPVHSAQTKAENEEAREPVDVEAVIQQLVREGIIIPADDPKAQPAPLARRPGALARFLDSRR